LRSAITGQFATLSADTLLVQNAETGFGPPGSTAITKLNEHDLKLIESVKGTKQVIPRLLKIVKLEYNDALVFSYLASMPEDKDQLKFIYENLNVGVEDGRLLNNGDYGKVLLGYDVAHSSDFDKDISTGSRIVIQGKTFVVIGVLKKASSFQINSVILMLDKDMKDLLNIQDEISFIVVRADSKDNVQDVADEIAKVLRKDRKEKKGEEDFTIQTPLQALQAVNSILNVVNAVIIGIAAISLLIGGIGIANTMYTSVLERKSEIGTMKAIGAKNSDIWKLFVIESGLFGLIGGITGACFGIFLAYLASISANAFFGEDIFAFSISWMLVIGAIMFSFLIGILAGLIPSYQASKLKPVDALRG
jgi:putative ABC transport system permease protein